MNPLQDIHELLGISKDTATDVSPFCDPTCQRPLKDADNKAMSGNDVTSEPIQLLKDCNVSIIQSYHIPLVLEHKIQCEIRTVHTDEAPFSPTANV